MISSKEGFTLIEVLVAISILVILMLVLSATLGGALNLNRQSQRQLGTTSGVQEMMENIRNAWQNDANYIKACAPAVTLPTGYRATFINLSTRAEPITQDNVVINPASAAVPISLNTSSGNSCTASTGAALSSGGIPQMRRIIIVSGSAEQDATLSLDFLRPGP